MPYQHSGRMPQVHVTTYTTKIVVTNEQGTEILNEEFKLPMWNPTDQKLKKLERVLERVSEDMTVAKYKVYESIRHDMKL